MIGRMRYSIEIVSTETVKDSMGVGTKTDIVRAKTRALKEDRRGSEKWRNFAAFSDANALFRFRKIPGLEVTTSHFILCEGHRYDIFNVEDVRGRGMYIEVLAQKTEPSVK